MDLLASSTPSFNAIKDIIKKSVEAINDYNDTFKQEYFFTFSNSKQKAELYIEEYRKFRAVFNSYFNDIDRYSSQISSMLLEADRSGDVETLSILKNVFEGYLDLEKSFSKFSIAIEKEISKNEPSISVLTENLSKLRIAIISFYEKL